MKLEALRVLAHELHRVSEYIEDRLFESVNSFGVEGEYRNGALEDLDQAARNWLELRGHRVTK